MVWFNWFNFQFKTTRTFSHSRERRENEWWMVWGFKTVENFLMGHGTVTERTVEINRAWNIVQQTYWHRDWDVTTSLITGYLRQLLLFCLVFPPKKELSIYARIRQSNLIKLQLHKIERRRSFGVEIQRNSVPHEKL